MEILEIQNSSAVKKVCFNYDENQVGVAYTYKQDNFYFFGCSDVEDFKSKINSAESVGKLISQSKKDGTLQSIDI